MLQCLFSISVILSMSPFLSLVSKIFYSFKTGNHPDSVLYSINFPRVASFMPMFSLYLFTNTSSPVTWAKDPLSQPPADICFPLIDSIVCQTHYFQDTTYYSFPKLCFFFCVGKYSPPSCKRGSDTPIYVFLLPPLIRNEDLSIPPLKLHIYLYLIAHCLYHLQ